MGWRDIVEKMHMTATLTRWYADHRNMRIIAGGEKVNLPFAGRRQCGAPACPGEKPLAKAQEVGSLGDQRH
jgi:hypothetical protein